MARAALTWAAVGLIIAVAFWFAVTSPLLAWRDWIYILGGVAGVLSLALLLLQPLLIAGVLPGLSPVHARRWHFCLGIALLIAVLVHVGALWVTSPPDVIDALLLRSPTPFAIWGVVAMWAVFAAAILGMWRKRLPLSLRSWRIAHTGIAILIVAGTVIHAVLITGTMETLSKLALCTAALFALGFAVVRRRIWARSR